MRSSELSSIAPLKVHAVLGAALVLAGLLFDFGVLTTSAAFEEGLRPLPPPILWKRYAYELTRFYLFALGLTSMALGLVNHALAVEPRRAWVIVALLTSGTALFIAGGLWEAQIGPVTRMEPPCYVLGGGLFAVLGALVLEVYALLRSPLTAAGT